MSNGMVFYGPMITNVSKTLKNNQKWIKYIISIPYIIQVGLFKRISDIL